MRTYAADMQIKKNQKQNGIDVNIEEKVSEEIKGK